MAPRFDPQWHHRRSIRLAGYDYTQAGAYFVTVCTAGRNCLFGEIVDDQMRLNEAGQIVQAAWDDLPKHYPHVDLDAFVVMPNHVHGIVVLTTEAERETAASDATVQDGNAPSVGAGFKPALSPLKPAHPHPQPAHLRSGPGHRPLPTTPARSAASLSEIIRAFKTFSARRINNLRGVSAMPIWQRNYYEHVIRNDAALQRIRQYIAENPAHWADDQENPVNLGKRPG